MFAIICKTKEEVKADIEYRRFLNKACDDLTDKELNKEPTHTPEITITPLAFNFMRINNY